MGERRYSSTFLDLGIKWRIVSTLCPGRYTPRERALDTHWLGSLVGPRAGLEAVKKREIVSCRKLNPGLPARSPSLYRLSYPDSSVKSGREDITLYNFRRWNNNDKTVACAVDKKISKM
jgi:hypothetical protein